MKKNLLNLDNTMYISKMLLPYLILCPIYSVFNSSLKNNSRIFCIPLGKPQGAW